MFAFKRGPHCAVYRLAFELGTKGTTVYRDHSRENQVMRAAGKRPHPVAGGLSPRPRPRRTWGETFKFRMGCGTLFVTVNRDDQGFCEVFANLGKAGGCPSQSEATCRVVSTALWCGVDPGILLEQMRNIRCLSTMARRKTNKEIDVLSCPDAIARAIGQVLGGGREGEPAFRANECPDCGHPLRRQEGCNVCDNCS